MAKQTAKTELKFGDITYPFYRTMRGQWDFEQAGFTLADIASAKVSAQLAYIYFQLRDCAKRAKLEFKFSLDDFVDDADESLLTVFTRLHKEEKRIKEQEGTGDLGKQDQKEN